MDKRAALVFATNYLKEYFQKHNVGVTALIQSQWTRGVYSGRQEAINILTEAATKFEETNA